MRSRQPMNPFSYQPGAKEELMSQIMNAVAAECGVTVNEIVGPHRRPETVVIARHIAMYFCYRLTGASAEKVAHAFNRTDHSTILNACKRTIEMIACYPAIAASCRRLWRQLDPDHANAREALPAQKDPRPSHAWS